MAVAAEHRPLDTPRAQPAASTQRRLLVAVMLAIGLVDQLSKAWAWRYVTRVHINSGSGLLFGDRAGSWYRDGLRAIAIDAVGAVLITVLAAALVRRRRPTVAFLGAAMALGGWASNLGDRLGLHAVTAPGTRQGVVDFLHWEGRLWNVADLAIMVGTGICILACLYAVLLSGGRDPL
jgi:lipoprotein signal peptidase